MSFILSFFAFLILSLTTGGTGLEAQAQGPSQVLSAPATTPTPEEWMSAVFERENLTLPSTARVLFTSSSNCGADLSSEGLGGCTYRTADGPVITISPELANTESGEHVLFHEAGHALGIADECAAEAFAHSKTHNYNMWSYPQCSTGTGTR